MAVNTIYIDQGLPGTSFISIGRLLLRNTIASLLAARATRNTF